MEDTVTETSLGRVHSSGELVRLDDPVPAQEPVEFLFLGAALDGGYAERRVLDFQVSPRFPKPGGVALPPAPPHTNLPFAPRPLFVPSSLGPHRSLVLPFLCPTELKDGEPGGSPECCS
jgi:hypothetical protein